VVPIIGLSDQTHLANFLGDKKAWPVYLTIRNILSRCNGSTPRKMDPRVATAPTTSNLSPKVHRNIRVK
ncbi:hypothetical protein C7212DRAFT_156257, partial [Tuber magnatum]